MFNAAKPHKKGTIMKKIFSLFLAITLVLGANAVESRKTATLKEESRKTTAQTTIKSTLPAHAIKALETAALKGKSQKAKVESRKTPAATTDEAIVINANNLQEDLYYGYFPYIYGSNEAYTVVAFFWGDETFGEYVDNDENLEITIYDNSLGDDDEGVALEYTNAKYERNEKGLCFKAVGTGDDGQAYDITLTFYAPDEPNDTIRYAFANAQGDVFTSQEAYIAYAHDEKYECVLALNSLIPTAGTYSDPDGEVIFDNTYIQAIDGTDTTYVGNPFNVKVEVEETATAYTFTLNYFATDSNYYVMTLPVAKIAPEGDTIKHVFNTPVYATYYGETQDYYFSVSDAEAIVTLDMFVENFEAGTYSISQAGLFDLYYTRAYAISGTDTTALDYRNLEIIVKENADDYDIAANFHVKADNRIHQYSAKYLKPKAKETVTMTIEDYRFEDYRDWDGSFDIIAAPADSSIVFVLEFLSTELAGTYTEKNLSGQYTYVGVGGKYYGVDRAVLTITGEDENALVIEGEVLSNSVLYKLTIGQAQTSVERVDANAVKPTKFIRNGQLFILKDGKTYNVAGAQVK